ncbi:MAG: SCO family protein [Campylobacterales bacterium]|nr:SCO family protein [Campylobacterales bacterium]
MVLPTLFTKGVSRMELAKPLSLELLKQQDKSVLLLFFGYSGCVDVCIPRLTSLAQFYETSESATQKALGVVFMDISLPKDETLSQRFAEFFHKSFVGIQLTKQQLREYTKPFDVSFAPSLMQEGEYEHSANLYLLKQDGKTQELRYVYTAYPYDFEQIRADIKELMNE